jgi:ATP-dependent Clp protease ATP-binding subunit ClpB
MIREEVSEEDIAGVVSRWTGIPVTRLIRAESEKLKKLEEAMAERVVGQDDALHAVANAVRRSRSGITPAGRPIAVFLFLGPTGVGKTETAKALAEQLFSDEHALVRIDMSELSEQHSSARLIGAPPGYVGYEEGGQLTETVRRKPYTVVLLDEIEKAHPQIFSLFLQMFDEGRLTDGKGRTVDFTNAVIIMTSNIGAEIIQRYRGKEKEKMEAEIGELLHRSFRPEFLNRIDKVIFFNELSEDRLKKVVAIQMQSVISRLREQQVTLALSESAKAYLARKGYDPVFGARPLKRIIQNEILDETALLILDKEENSPLTIEVEEKNGKLEVKQKVL